MSQVAEESTLLFPPETCSRCKAEVAPNGLDTELENYRCPHCAEKCCNRCFVTNYDGDGHTFFCPNPSCKKLLKFP